MNTPRNVTLRIRLTGGHEQVVALQEDAPELTTLFTALSSPYSESRFVQLPVDGGRVAFSFQTSQLVAIVSEPPVVLNLADPPAVQGATAAAALSNPAPASVLRRPRYVVVDDFLSPQEHDELLAYAVISQDQFQAGTVTTYEPDVRQNLVILNFGDSVHSRLFENRLLVHYPLFARALGIPVFPLAPIESQLTAAGDGYYFKVHTDEAPDVPRVLTCVYYLHRQPRGFAGGELRLYDVIEEGDARRSAETFTALAPVANRLVVFPSNEFHEALPVRCPSKAFEDNRFAVTTWLHRAERPDSQARFGWGHFQCGVVARQFAAPSTGGN